jgi:hypothetical protein
MHDILRHLLRRNSDYLLKFLRLTAATGSKTACLDTVKIHLLMAKMLEHTHGNLGRPNVNLQ